jgi:hypothetical protein
MYYYRARYYDPSTGRFLQQDPEPGKLRMPATVVNKYIYVGNLPNMLTDSTGRDPWKDFVNFIGRAILYTIAIIATVLDLVLGTIAYLSDMKNREAPFLHFEDGWTIENSFFADLFGDSASWGPVIFLESKEEYRGTTWKHEYGHRLQYFEIGGWEYMRFMFARKFNVGQFAHPLEFDADKRATEYFGENICNYHHIM